MQVGTHYLLATPWILRLSRPGAYRNQLSTIDPKTGEANFDRPTAEGTYTWSLDTAFYEGSVYTADGAKGDCLVWPGDLVIQR